MDYSFDVNPVFLSHFVPKGIHHWIERSVLGISRGAAAAIHVFEIATFAKNSDKLLNGIVVEGVESNSNFPEAARFFEVSYTLNKSGGGVGAAAILANRAAAANVQLSGLGLAGGRNAKTDFMNWVIVPSVFTTTNTFVAVERTERYKLDMLLRGAEKLYMVCDDTVLVNGDDVCIYVTLDYYSGKLKDKGVLG